MMELLKGAAIGRGSPIMGYALWGFTWLLLPNLLPIYMNFDYSIDFYSQLLTFAGMGFLWRPKLRLVFTLLFTGLYGTFCVGLLSKVFGLTEGIVLSTVSLQSLRFLLEPEYLAIAMLALVGWASTLIMAWSIESRPFRLHSLAICAVPCVLAISIDVKADADSNYVEMKERDLKYMALQFGLIEPEIGTMPSSIVQNGVLDVAKNKGDILVVMMESLGFPEQSGNSDSFRQLIGLSELSDLYQIEGGTIEFRGATTAAEIREFCGKDFSYRQLLDSAELGSDCLPGHLAAQGYKTVALHNYYGIFFERATWYPLIGFEESVFLDQFPADGSRCGYIWVGVCDDQVTEKIVEVFRDADTPVLAYWLTLYGHVPIDNALREKYQDGCSNGSLEIANPDVCGMLSSQRDSIRSLKSALEASEAPLPHIFVVGDHAPPFLKKDPRLFFNQRHVPWYVLTPKGTS